MSAPIRIVVCSLEPWDEVWRRNQHILDHLLRSDASVEVLIVEPPVDPVHDLIHRRPARRGGGLRTIDGYDGRLTAFEPTKYGPRSALPGVQASLQRQTIRAIGALGWKRPVLWINDPMWASLLSLEWPTLYDVTDDWNHADRPRRVRERIVRADRALIAGADAVVVCSPTLQNRKGGTLVRNGVDVQSYRIPAERPVDLPMGPTAVYVGTLHEDRLDVDLVVATATRLAESGATLSLIGPDALDPATSARLHATAGLRLLGSRPAQSVPAYLQHADALVVPHVVDGFTDSLDPIKLYEYLAAGRPVVSTPVAGFREAASRYGIAIADTAQFPDAVAAAVSTWHPTVLHDAIPTWADRAMEMMDVIERIDAEVMS